MSNDLISRGVFRKQVAAMAVKEGYNPTKASAMVKLIDSQPIAYDTDKVIKQLENKIAEYKTRIAARSGNCYHDETEKIRILSERMYGIEQALEIVKAGGKGDGTGNN